MKSNTKVVKDFRKLIKKDLKEHFECTQFKISLNFVEDKHIPLCKRYLNTIVEDQIFRNPQKFDKYNAHQYLEQCLSKFVFDLYGLELPKIEDMNLKKKNEVITLEKAITMYLSKQKEKVSEGTFNGYNSKANHLTSFFGKDKDVESIRSLDIEKYQEELSSKLSNNVVNNTMSFGSGLFKYLQSRELLEKNVFTLIEYKEVIDADKESFSNSEVVKLLNNDDLDLRLMYKLSAYCGFRIGEAMNLKVENIDFKENSIRSVLKDTKTKKHTRTSPIHPSLIDDLKSIIGNRKKGNLVYDSIKITQKSQQGKINRSINSLVNNSKKTFHSFRSAFASKIDNYDLKDIKILLGHKHKDITVKAYLKNNINWSKKTEMINQISYQ